MTTSKVLKSPRAWRRWKMKRGMSQASMDFDDINNREQNFSISERSDLVVSAAGNANQDAGTPDSETASTNNASTEDETSSSADAMIEWVQSLPPHQKFFFVVTVFVILSFCATRNSFFLKILPFLLILQILRVFLIWIIFLTDTAEAGLLRDIFYMLGGRVKTEVERTREGGRVRRKLEAGTLGFVNLFHGRIFSFWEGYFDNIENKAREGRRKNTNNFLKALNHQKDS